MRRSRRTGVFLAAAAGAVFCQVAPAANFSWTFDGGGTSWNANWTDAGNWAPNTVPNSSSAAVFFPSQPVVGGPGSVALATTVAANSLQFNSSGGSGYTVTGPGTINLTGGGTIDVTAGSTGTLAGGMRITSSSGWTKTGGGTLMLAGAGTFAGTPITISAGTIQIAGTYPVGSGTIFLAGGALGIGGTAQLNASGPINVPAGSSGTFAIGTSAINDFTLFGGGTLSFVGSGTPLVAATGTWSAFTGTLDFSNVSTLLRLNTSLQNNTGAAGAYWNLGNNTLILAQRQGNFGTNGTNMGALSGGPNVMVTGAQNATGNTTTWIIGSLNLSTTFAGAFLDADASARTVGLAKVGNGALTLTGTSNMTGAINVNAGQLLIGPGGRLAGNPFDSTLSQQININAGTFGIVGSGTLADSKAIAITNGIFDVSGTAGSYSNPGSVTLIGISSPGNTGYVRGNVNHAAGTISPGGNDTAGTILFGALGDLSTLDFSGGQIVLDLNSIGTLGSGVNDIIVANGTLNIQSSAIFRLNFPGDTYPFTFNGEIPIIKYNGTLTGSLQPLITSGVRDGYELVNHPGAGGGTLAIKSVGDETFPHQITWTGAVDNDWDLNITSNFTESSTPVTFFQIDTVFMNDTASTGTVNLVKAKIVPGALNINNNALPYTLLGAGTLSGSGSLLKNGTGQLTVLTTNTYTGATTINGGIVRLGPDTGGKNASFLGSGSVYINNATVSISNNTITNDTFIPTGSAATLVFNNTGATGSGNWGGNLHGGGTINLRANGNNNGAGSIGIISDNTAATGTVNLLLDPAFPSGSIEVRGFDPTFTGNLFWNLPNTVTPQARLTSSIFDPWATEIPLAGISGNGSLQGLRTGGPSSIKRWLIGSANIDVTWAGAVVDGQGTPTTLSPSGITKTGTASLTLTGTALTYSGPTIVNQGVLVLDGIAGGSLAGNLQGTNFVTVNGGTFLMRSGAQLGKASFAPSPDDVTAGVVMSANTGGHIDLSQSLNYTPASGPPRFQLPVGLTLTGDGGTIHGPIQLGTFGADVGINPTGRGTINPGDGGLGKAGTLTIDELHVGAGGTMIFDLSASTTAGGGVNDLLVASSLLDMSGGSLVVNFNAGATAGSTYRLINAGNVNSAAVSNLILNGRGVAANLASTLGTNGHVDLVVTQSSTAKPLRYATAPGILFVARSWDVNTSANWQNTLNNGTENFYPTDAVTFDALGNYGTVVITTPVFPSSVTVDAPAGNGYTFAGTTWLGTTNTTARLQQTAGRISGATGLTKTGAGALMILTDNDYTGGTNITGGTLQVGDVGTVSNNRFAAAISGSVGSGPVSISSGATLALARRDAYVIPGAISGGGTLFKAGTSEVRLDGTNSYTGGTVIGSGVVRMGSDNAIPGNSTVTITSMPNPLNNSAQIGGSLNLFGHNLLLGALLSTSSGNTGTFGSGMLGNVTNTGNTVLTATPTLTIASANFSAGITGNLNLVKVSSAVATMSYSNTTFTGRTDVNAGTLQVVAGPGAGTHSGGASASYTVAAGAALAGNGTILAPVNVLPGGIVAPGVFGGSIQSQIGTLSMGSLALGSSIINLDFNGLAMDQIHLLNNIGSFGNGFASLSGVTTINLNNVAATTGGYVVAGQYPVIDYIGNALSDVSAFTLGTNNLGSGFPLALVNNTSNTSVDLAVIQNTVTGTWNNAAGGSWTTPQNWVTNPFGGTPNAVDSIAVFGSAISGPQAVTLDAPKTVGTINFDSANSYLLSGSGLTTITLAASSGATGISVSSGTHIISAPVVAANNATVDVAGSNILSLAASLTINQSLTKTGSGNLIVAHVRNAGGFDGTSSLNVTGGRLAVNATTPGDTSGTSRINALSISSGAVMDLTDNALIIDYSTGSGPGTLLDDLRSMLASGRLQTSTPPPAGLDTRIGYRDNNIATGMGNSTVLNFAGLAVDSSSALLKYTFGGDTNLDGTVDVKDLYNLALHFNAPGNWHWADGDANYDGVVNVADLTLMARDWQAVSSQFASALASLGLPEVSIPEPTGMALVGVALAAMQRRRRHTPSPSGRGQG